MLQGCRATHIKRHGHPIWLLPALGNGLPAPKVLEPETEVLGQGIVPGSELLGLNGAPGHRLLVMTLDVVELGVARSCEK